MAEQELGRLEKVPLRKQWELEDKNFTTWLAEPQNIQVLAEAISLPLDVLETEKNVGPFRADILCQTPANESLVLIENQLEPTDHKHLGQIITYAAGLDAVTVIWIAKHFTEQHRAAIDWLNRITHDDFNFFGIEIQLWKIGDSLPAPKFDVIAKPNDWAKTVKDFASGSHGPLTETQQAKLDFWKGYVDYLDKVDSSLTRPRPRPNNWVGYGIGRAYFTLSPVISFRDNCIWVWINIAGPDAKSYFRLLERDKAAIEKKLGFALEWREKADQIESQIAVAHKIKLSDRKNWPKAHKWLVEKLGEFDEVFRPQLKDLDLDDLEND